MPMSCDRSGPRGSSRLLSGSCKNWTWTALRPTWALGPAPSDTAKRPGEIPSEKSGMIWQRGATRIKKGRPPGRSFFESG